MSAAAFSTPDNICLEREVEKDECIKFESIWTDNNKEMCIKWVNENKYKKTCLQFPDSYLPYSVKICDDLRNTCSDTKFYILADTSYGSCCVDEIAAEHVESDNLIHFGNACQSKISRLPVLYVFPQLTFDLINFCTNLKELKVEAQKLIIYFGLEYQYILDESKQLHEQIKQNLPENINFSIKKYTKSQTTEDDKDTICIFIGRDSQLFFNLTMSVIASKWIIYDPYTNSLQETNPLTTNYIRRRYFYIEKCKDAQTLGLVVATLTAEGYLDIIKHIQEMARARGIRTYIISVGRINPAKLANFMEIDCFILIGCSFNNLYTSREFYKPIVSVFEAEMALNPAWHTKLPETYITDFQDILPSGKFYNEFKIGDIVENDISLVTGKLRNVTQSNGNNTENVDGQNVIIERKNYQLMEVNRGRVFEDRSWRGLDPSLGDVEPVKITKGLSGIPIKYSHD